MVVETHAGQPATTIGVGCEEFCIGDDDDTIPATDEELQQALEDVEPQVIGNSSDMPHDLQYICGINDGRHAVLVIRAWPHDAGQPAEQRPQSRQAWRRVIRNDDDQE
mgnify:CR=1 FL=1